MRRFDLRVRPNTALINVDFNMFFDRRKVIDSMHAKERVAFSKIGGFVRQTMRRSMRPSTAKTPHAKAGDPPRYSEKLIRNKIFYWYDYRRHSVIIGPQKITVNSIVQPSNRKSVPELLDKGGDAAANREQLVIRNRKTKQLVAFNSLGGQKIYRRLRQSQARGGRSDWYLMKLPPGKRKFEARPFTQRALAANLTNAKLRASFRVIRGF